MAAARAVLLQGWRRCTATLPLWTRPALSLASQCATRKRLRTAATASSTDGNSSEETFQEVLDSSGLGSLAGRLAGRRVSAKVVRRRPTYLLLDLGLKFPAKIPTSSLSNVHDTRVGALIDVLIADPELTGHFVGDSKHTSSYTAKVVIPPRQFTHSLRKLERRSAR